MNQLRTVAAGGGTMHCPNPPEFIILKSDGQITFAIMCAPHKFGFEFDFGYLKGTYTVEPYTVVRAQELVKLAVEESL